MPDCDILLVAGDIGLDENFRENGQYGLRMEDWHTWLHELPMPCVAIAGNHDFRPDLLRDLPWIYLQDKTAEVCGLKIFGTPWSNPFGYGWAFNMSEDRQIENLKKCPEDVDIIISHGPPYGYCDLVGSWRGNPPKHVGSFALNDLMGELPNLKLIATGHIHCAYGAEEEDGVWVVNGSLVNEDYQVANPVIVLDV